MSLVQLCHIHFKILSHLWFARVLILLPNAVYISLVHCFQFLICIHSLISPIWRSANSRTCVVRRTCSSYGDRCFAAASPRLWNNLPAYLRQTDINF